MNLNWIISIIAALAGVTLGWFLKGCGAPETTVVERRDTVTVVQMLPEVIERRVPVVVRGDPIVFRDTVTINGVDTVTEFVAPPFAMRLDTVEADGDTINVLASHPPPRITITRRPPPDTTTTRTEYIHLPPPKEKWYAEPLKLGVTFGGGFLAGYLTRTFTHDDDKCRPLQTTEKPPALVNLNVRF